MGFNLVRRQHFLSEDDYQASVELFGQRIPAYLEVLNSKNASAIDRSRVSFAIADEVFGHFLIQYTAGVPIHTLRAGFEDVVTSLEQHAKYIREHAQRPAFPPLRFSVISDYEWAMQLIGLCYLLHRRDLLQRIADLFDGAFAAKDTLYEDLLAYELYDRFEVDKWYHDKPYRDLINSLYRETPEESIVDLQKYLQDWYRSMEQAPWHDGHLRTSRIGGGGYAGYWAIEAAAVAYLLELDDSSFRENVVYPGDLVDYARALDDIP